MRGSLWPGMMLAIVLGGCGTMQAYRARSALLGASEPDIIACMGVPAEKQYLSRDQSVMQWDYAQSGTDIDIEFGIYSLKLGRPGICHAAIRFDRGQVRSVHYAGVDVGPTNPDSICGRLVKECLDHREQTMLPPDFDSLAVLDGKPNPGPGVAAVP
jgi:hypothetical protein